MRIIGAFVGRISRFVRKAFDIMANSGGKRGTERGLPEYVTKRARTTPSSSAGSHLNCFGSTKEKDKRMLARKLESCQSQLNDRDLKIATLENNRIAADQVILELEDRVTKMQQQLCKELEECGSYADGGATPFLLESTLKGVTMSTSAFTKVFLDYAKSHAVDANCALTKHYENPFLTRPAHLTYLLRAWTFKALFLDFENESFSPGGTSIFLDHTERRVKSFKYFQLLETNVAVLDPCAEHWFENFRRQKLRQFLSLWQSFDQVAAGNLFSDALLQSRHEEQNVRLMESFRSVAKGVWALHKLSLSFPTRAEIFRVSQHNEFNAEYMESAVSREDDERFVSKVGFMICPGFRLKRSVLKCQIYLARDPDLRD